jgi:uncharacterized iron-regulated protein
MSRLPAVLAAALLLLAGCASPLATTATSDEVAVLLLGEQHDAPTHQKLHADVLQSLASRERLAAVVIEMAEQGRSTAGLLPDAAEDQVKEALRWPARGWQWSDYGPAVMVAVRAGVPVLGGNLPRERMRTAMDDAALEALLPAESLRAQRDAIRVGHCDLLPETQLGPMTRVQIARDRAMAETLVKAVTPGKTVVLLAGSGHVDPQLGVPRHLPAHLRAQPVMLPREDTGKDYCAELRKQMPRHGTGS